MRDMAEGYSTHLGLINLVFPVQVRGSAPKVDTETLNPCVQWS